MNKKLLTYSGYLYLMTYAFTVTTIGPCNAEIDNTFDAGKRVMGLLMSSHFLGFLITTAYAGYLINRFTLKKLMVGGVALLGVSLVCFSQSRNLPILFASMILMGFGGGAVEVGINTLIPTMYSEKRVYALNLLHVYFGVGAFTWPYLAGTLLHSGLSWRALYLIVAGFSFLMTAIMSVQKFPPEEGGEQIRMMDAVRTMKRPTVFLLGMVVALYVGGEMGINNWVVRYFDEELHFPATKVPYISFTITSSFFLTVFWFSMTVGRLFSTAAGKFVPDHVLLRVLTAASAVFGLAAFIVKSPVAAAVFLALTGFSFSGIFATAIGIGANRFPERIGLISGVIIAFSGAGNVLLNYLVGEIAQNAGSIRAGLIFSAALLILMAVCAFGIKKSPLLYKRDSL